MKKSAFALALLMCCSSCSDQQLTGALVGGTVGSMLGTTVLGFVGGPRGADAGSAIGLISGVAIGSAIAAKSEQKRSSDYDDCQQSEVYQQRSSRQQRERVEERKLERMANQLSVENLRLIDPSKNKCLNVGERCQIAFELYNRSNKPIYNVTPVFTTDTKRLILSPSVTIECILPGKGMRYKIEAYTRARIKKHVVNFTLSVVVNGQTIPLRTFQLDAE